MVGCVCIIAYIAVAAVTGISCIALLCAGRSCNNLCIAVTCCRNNLCFKVVATDADSLFLAVFKAGGILDNYPFAEFTAESFNKVILISVSAL